MSWTHTADWTDQAVADWVKGFRDMGVDPLFPAQAAMNESNLSAKAHNNNGNASGLIQFMPATLAGMGWTGPSDLASFRALSTDEQIPWVLKYYKQHAPYINSAALCYVTTFLPALTKEASENGMSYVLATDAAHTNLLTPYAQGVNGSNGVLVTAYKWNPGFDHDKKGYITVQDLQTTIEQTIGNAQNAPRWQEFVQRLDLTEGGNGDGAIALGGGGVTTGFQASLGHALAKFGIGAHLGGHVAPSHSRDIVVFGLGMAAGVCAVKYGPQAYDRAKFYGAKAWTKVARFGPQISIKTRKMGT